MTNSRLRKTDATHDTADVKWYAGLAMQAMIGRQGIPQTESAREEIALWSYRMGEAMVAIEDRLHPT